MHQEPRHDLGRDRGSRQGAGECADALGAVNVLGIERLPEDVGAHDRNDHRRLNRNDRLVIGRSLERTHAGAVRFTQEAGVRTPRCARCHDEGTLNLMVLKTQPERIATIRRMAALPGSGVRPDQVIAIAEAFETLVSSP